MVPSPCCVVPFDRASCAVAQRMPEYNTGGENPETMTSADGSEPPQGWTRRDWNVLLELARGDDSLVGFQGIKRRLDLHPEALRRSLTRLVRSGEVEKTDGGYRLTDSGHASIRGVELPRPAGRPVPVAAFLLPSQISMDALAERFSGRWFDGLHWYGIEPSPGQTVLKWLTHSDTFVTIRTGAGVVRVEADGKDGADALVHAAAPLVAAVASWLRHGEGTGTPDGTFWHGDEPGQAS